jgi:hypothetical protein
MYDLTEMEARELGASLRTFAENEKLSEFPNPPRRIGKQFFMSIFDTSRFSLVFEKASRDLPLVIECQHFSDGTTVSDGASVCEAALKRLHVFLSERYAPLLFWVYRKDPLPLGLGSVTGPTSP